VDFLEKTGTVNFQPGQTQASFVVPVNPDGINELPKEIFQVELTNPVGGSIYRAFGTGAIIDSNGVNVAIANAANIENNDVEFDVVRSYNDGSTVVFNFSTMDVPGGGAVGGRNYVISNLVNLTIPDSRNPPDPLSTIN